MESVREEMLRELDRITNRLASLNPERLAAMDESVYRCATAIWNATQGHDYELNRVGPTAYAAQLTVLTRDLLMENPQGGPEAVSALTPLTPLTALTALTALTELRRELP
jgi:hypothetical protein